jgi:transposase
MSISVVMCGVKPMNGSKSRSKIRKNEKPILGRSISRQDIYTIAYLQYLMSQCPGQRLVLIWDGAAYHRSDEMKAFLASINDGLAESDWKITCLRFAPNDPTQNPIEAIWLSAKRYIREFYHQCKTFAAVKCLFELAVQHKVFDFPKLNRLGKFSLIT